MDSRQIASIILRAPKEVARALSDELPRKAAIISKNHFRQNFRESGFVDGGLRPWKRTRRQEAGDDRGPLLSRRNHLMNSIEAVPAPGQVIVTNPVPYAAIHNEGGTVNTHPTVTPKMRKMAWAKVYSLAGVRGKGKLPKEPTGSRRKVASAGPDKEDEAQHNSAYSETTVHRLKRGTARKDKQYHHRQTNTDKQWNHFSLISSIESPRNCHGYAPWTKTTVSWKLSTTRIQICTRSPFRLSS